MSERIALTMWISVCKDLCAKGSVKSTPHLWPGVVEIEKS